MGMLPIENQLIINMKLTPNNLRKEERNALGVLYRNMDRAHIRENSRITLQHIQTNNSFFSDNQLKTSFLPTRPGWVWNQSRSRKTVHQFGWEICFYKANVRQAKYSPISPPSCKVWIFHIKSCSESFCFLWCEKGIPTSSSSTFKPEFNSFTTTKTHHRPGNIHACDFELFQIDEFIVPVTLQDLSFLKPFVSSSSACAFEW